MEKRTAFCFLFIWQKLHASFPLRSLKKALVHTRDHGKFNLKKGQHSVLLLYTKTYRPTNDAYVVLLAPPLDPFGINKIWGRTSSFKSPLGSTRYGTSKWLRKNWLVFSSRDVQQEKKIDFGLARRPTHLCDSTVAAPHFPFRPAF